MSRVVRPMDEASGVHPGARCPRRTARLHVLAMTLAFDRDASKLRIETTAKGMLAKLAHDLAIEASDWTCEATLDGEKATLTAKVPVASLRVAGVRKHGTVDKNVLSSSDRSEIERKIREEVLTGREVVVAASASGIPADGSRTIDAELTVESGRAKARVSSRVTVSVTAGAVVASGRAGVSLSSLSIPPVKGPLGAFRVDDVVDVVFDARFTRVE